MTMTAVPFASITSDIQQLVFDAARILLYPVLVGLLVCLVWVLIELGAFLYEAVQRLRSRDMDVLEISALRARKAFADGKPRAAYRHLQENTYSIVVTRFLFDLIRNYQTERLAAKPLKLLQEYEFYTVRRLERTRILARVGPVLGLMGALIPLAPALAGLAQGDVAELTDNLEIAFSVAVIGLLIGGLAYVIGLIRDRMYSQDISDMEYLLELLEGNAERLESGRRRDRLGRWETDPFVTYVDVPDPTADTATIEPVEAAEESPAQTPTDDIAVPGTPLADQVNPPATPAASFDDPDMSWHTDDDPFAALGPAEAQEGPARHPGEELPGTNPSRFGDARDAT
jgi:biopolymer transport protein ExbB/TolQ